MGLEGTQDPAPNRAAGQGLATSQWRGSAQRNSGESGQTLAAARILGRPADPAVPPEDQRAEGFCCPGQRREGPQPGSSRSSAGRSDRPSRTVSHRAVALAPWSSSEVGGRRPVMIDLPCGLAAGWRPVEAPDWNDPAQRR